MGGSTLASFLVNSATSASAASARVLSWAICDCRLRMVVFSAVGERCVSEGSGVMQGAGVVRVWEGSGAGVGAGGV